MGEEDNGKDWMKQDLSGIRYNEVHSPVVMSYDD